MGYAKYFLGLEIARHSHGTYIHERKYFLDLLLDASLLGAKPALTPLPKGHKLVADSGPALAYHTSFRPLIGRLLYLNFTRPDLSYSVQYLNQFVAASRYSHRHAGIRDGQKKSKKWKKQNRN